jgi:Leucine-rich repeat (LRR) protein
LIDFPEVIFYLTRLEVLMIQKNKIKTMPSNYDFSPTVHTLNLAFNQFTQVPSTLLTKPPHALTHLHLSGNKLRSLPPKFLSIGFSKLVSLDLHTCQLTRIAPKIFEHLSKCRDLRRLNLAINRLADIPSEIGLLNQLQWLNLNDNLITSLPSTMSDLIHLVKLGLVQNRIEIFPPFMFLHMLELQKLDIRRNHLKYMPPSILALAPRQEVDIHVDLAVPHAVFQTLSTPACPTDKDGKVMEQACLDCHPYGGSLRTLLFYENPTIEHVDGILCDLGDEGEEERNSPESVQAMSMATIYSILQSNPSPNSKLALRQALIPPAEEKKKNVMYCNHPKFKRTDNNPIPNMLSEIDDEENSQNSQDSYVDEEERDSIRTETQLLLTRVLPLRELTLRSHLTQASLLLRQQQRLDQDPERTYLFIKSVLPNVIVPNMLQLSTLEGARQCDFCQCWYIDSKLQIGYLARLCSNRLQIPIRFNVCSIDCILEAVIRLYQTTIDWHTRQSLAHIDATLLLPPQPQQQQQPVQEQEQRRGSFNYWNVGLLSSTSAAANTVRRVSTNRTLGTTAAQENAGEEQQGSPTSTTRSNALTAASTSSSLSTESSLSCKRKL